MRRSLLVKGGRNPGASLLATEYIHCDGVGLSLGNSVRNLPLVVVGRPPLAPCIVIFLKKNGLEPVNPLANAALVFIFSKHFYEVNDFVYLRKLCGFIKYQMIPLSSFVWWEVAF